MSFVHPLLLGGLALVGLPVLLHLIMQQKPKRLPFPALRFLQQKRRTNQRKLQLRHLLLLLLRMALIALLAVALARPKLFSDRLNLGGDRPVDLVLVIDTSASMEYAVAGKTRLDDAKTRALELLDEFPESSRVAVVDTAEGLADWLPSVHAARERVAALVIRPANAPATASLPAAYTLLAAAAAEATEAAPAVIAVVGDRTPAGWDAERVTDLVKQRDRLPAKPLGLFLDVGVEKPLDVAVIDLAMKPQVVPANQPATLRATVRATGLDIDGELIARFDDGQPERRPVVAKAGQAVTVLLERRGLPPGWHQAEVTLATADNLPGNNSRYASFEVRSPRRVLIVSDTAQAAATLQLLWKNLYQVDVKLAADPATRALSRDDLSQYQAVALVSVATPGELWERLEEYVSRGGGLAVFPGGEEVLRADYGGTEASPARRLLPGALGGLVRSQAGAKWADERFAHPLMAPFKADAQQPTIDYVRFPRSAKRYWEVLTDEPRADVLARYDDDAKRPALVETKFDRGRVKGKVLLFTTPFDARQDPSGEAWNDYLQNSSFFLSVGLRAMRYLAGEAEDATFNYPTGAVPLVALPLDARFPTYTLAGPGLLASETSVPRPEGADELRLPQARQPGTYRLTGGPGGWQARFSLNVPGEEFTLLPRVPLSTPELEGAVERLFGPESVYPVGRAVPVKDALGKQLRQPVELFPLLMVLLLVVLAVENLLANKFYKRDVVSNGAGALPPR